MIDVAVGELAGAATTAVAAVLGPCIHAECYEFGPPTSARSRPEWARSRPDRLDRRRATLPRRARRVAAALARRGIFRSLRAGPHQ